MNERVRYIVQPGGCLRGRLRMPGDKSISHRVVMLGAIADGATTAEGFLHSEDTRATIGAFRAMGVRIDDVEPGRLLIEGTGREGLAAPFAPLYLGNSGTSARLLAGLLAGQRFDSELTGDESLSRRPMRRVAEPLRAMGAVIELSAQNTLPMRIRGGQALCGIDYTLPIASAQLKSCLLLAGLYASGRTTVREPVPTRDHTERLLRHFGCAVQRDGAMVTLTGGARLAGARVVIPGDISSAAFFLAGASIAPGSELVLEGVGVNPGRRAVIEILGQMGAEIEVLNERDLSGEPVADLYVRHRPLVGIEIPPELVPAAIDEFPAILVAAACARGTTLLSGATELRVKESDRIQAVADGLAAIGIRAEPRPDGLLVEGGHPVGGVVDSRGDHRIAMAFAMAALAAEAPIIIEDCMNVATSFPGFVETAQAVGLKILSETQ